MPPVRDTSPPIQSGGPPSSFAARALTAALLVGLYLLGMHGWVVFYNGGRLALTAQDWSKEVAEFGVLRAALASGRVPYHALNVYHPQQTFHGTDRFLGVPESTLSPQVLLLPYLDLAPFLLLNTLLLYSLGFLGCLLIRRRYRLGPVPFTFLFLLFHFNGHITSHLSVGHTMWGGYFLLPFLILCVLGWLDGRPPLRGALAAAFVLFAMMLQGSFHLVIWCWMFLALLGLSSRAYFKPAAVTVVFSALLSAFRVVPAALTFWGSQEYPFLGGYPSLNDLLEALVVPAEPSHARVAGMGWWEFDAYVGLLGFGGLFYFGVYRRLWPGPDLAACRYPALDVPLTLLALLALGSFYEPVVLLPLPLVNAERVTSRFLIVPLVLLVVLASVRMQQVLGEVKLPASGWLLIVAGLAVAAADLGQHSYAWRVVLHEADWPPLAPDPPWPLLDRPDPVYVAAVRLSALASALALAAWAFLLWRSGRGGAPATDGG